MTCFTNLKNGAVAFLTAISLVCSLPFCVVYGVLLAEKRWRYTLPAVILTAILVYFVGILPTIGGALALLILIPTGFLAAIIYNNRCPKCGLESSEIVIEKTISNKVEITCVHESVH
jgi:ABC-type molybdate transport system permease subunit